MVNNFSRTYKPQKKAEILFKPLADGGIIYVPAEEKVHSLNNTAAYIWSLCDGAHTLENISVQIKKDFKKLEADPLAEVKKTVGKFAEINILKPNDQSDSDH